MIGLTSNRKKESIYQLITAALDQDGHLPEQFNLPEDEEAGKLRFASGAMDGIGIFHTAKADVQKEVEELAALLEQACQRFDEAMMENITAFVKEHRVISLIDPLCARITQGKTGIQPDRLLLVGAALMTESADREAVKLGIAMCGLIDIEHNEACREAVLTLGKCDEFTLYSLVAVDGWSDDNEIVFQLAKEVHGWGKIHAVERLEPVTDEIRDWIIAKGCENSILNEYLGLVCAQSGDLLSYLKREVLSPELFRGAGIILTAMLDEGPTAGISMYEEAEPALVLFLSHAQKYSDLHTCYRVLLLEQWIKDSEISNKELLLKLCKEIRNKALWPDVVREAVLNADDSTLWQACFIAREIPIEIKELLFERISRDPVKHCWLAQDLFPIPEYAQKLFSLYEQVLPLEKIASGMGEDYALHSCLEVVVEQLKAYPGERLMLIKAALGSPVFRSRNCACRVLEAWHTEYGMDVPGNNEDFRGFLQSIEKHEVDEELKKRLGKLCKA